MFYTDVSGDDKEENDNVHIAIPLLLRNALPDVQGYEKNEKTDIALSPEQVSVEIISSSFQMLSLHFLLRVSGLFWALQGLKVTSHYEKNTILAMFSFSMCWEVVRREMIEGSSIEFIGYQIPQHKQNGCSLIHKASINKTVSGFFDILIGYRDIHI